MVVFLFWKILLKEAEICIGPTDNFFTRAWSNIGYDRQGRLCGVICRELGREIGR